MRRTLASLALATVLFATHSPVPAHAAVCDCPPTPDFTAAFDAAAWVFSGQVIAQDPYGSINGQPLFIVHPYERWKSPLRSDPTEVVTALPTTGCSYPFVIGQDYLFFAGAIDVGVTPNYVPYVTLCTRTAPLAGNPDLLTLGSSLLPVPVAPRTWGRLKSVYR